MKQIVLLILLFAGIDRSNACTTFFVHLNGKMVFGHNYDWMADEGMVCSNQRGLAKTSMKMPDGNTISWTSRYGSITFNQYGKEFPTGGMNENGLVVELMWLDATVYPGPDDRPSIAMDPVSVGQLFKYRRSYQKRFVGSHYFKRNTIALSCSRC